MECPGDGIWRNEPVAVLASGGLDSAVLVAELAAHSPRVAPLYVRCGLLWEQDEEAGMKRFLAALAAHNVEPLRTFESPMREVYGKHWSTGGDAAPDGDSADAAVYMPGRNLLLLAATSIWCHLHGIATIALGTLKGNPFPDATADFFDAYATLFNRGVSGRLRVVLPYSELSKPNVVSRGRQFPLHETFSCVDPVVSRHCGRCNKCAERRRSFAVAGIVDPTAYAHASHASSRRGAM